MGLGPPHFYFWGGLASPVFNVEFCLNMFKNHNKQAIGSIVKVNRLMKNMLQNFGSVCQYYLYYIYL